MWENYHIVYKNILFWWRNFNKTGKIVKVNNNSKTKLFDILDSLSYNIKNGTNLSAGQTSLSIKHNVWR